HVEPLLEQADQVLRGVALHRRGLGIGAAELLLGDVAVIEQKILLGAQLQAIVAGLALAALAMLTGAVFALVDRAFRATPDVLAHPAVELVFGAGALGHRYSLNCVAKVPEPRGCGL